MTTPTSREIVRRAWEAHTAIPSFNIPYPPMMAPVIRALRDTETLGQVTAARVEWLRFEAGGPRVLWEQYQELKDERYVRLHLDHVPVIDESDQHVDYLPIVAEALELGFDSVMVDGSRLSLADNIAATRRVVEMAKVAGKIGTDTIFFGRAAEQSKPSEENSVCPDFSAAVEGELGAVLGHEAGPLPPYEELFASGRGFTDVDEARRFVVETGVDWLSIAAGNIHGAVSGVARHEKKVEARLDVAHLAKLAEATGVPLVLHGGSGIKREYVQEGIRAGIAKINIGTNIRQPYEQGRRESVAVAQQSVYETVVQLVTEELQVAGSARTLAL